MPRTETFRQPIAKPAKVGPEVNPWFWNPNLPGVRTAPPSFKERLWREVGDDVEITWNPIRERWMVWERAPRIQHPICRGWKLLFLHEGPDKEYLPLDERVFARLFYASVMVQGSGREYFNRIVAEMERDREKAKEQALQDTIDEAMPFFDHSQISVSMRGHSNGSKFATYLS